MGNRKAAKKLIDQAVKEVEVSDKDLAELQDQVDEQKEEIAQLKEAVLTLGEEIETIKLATAEKKAGAKE